MCPQISTITGNEELLLRHRPHMVKCAQKTIPTRFTRLTRSKSKERIKEFVGINSQTGSRNSNLVGGLPIGRVSESSQPAPRPGQGELTDREYENAMLRAVGDAKGAQPRLMLTNDRGEHFFISPHFLPCSGLNGGFGNETAPVKDSFETTAL